MNIFLEWTDFKTVAFTKAHIRFGENAEFYSIFYTDTISTFHTTILKDAGADQTDFEANYKAAANKPMSGQRPFSDASGYRARFKGISGTVPFGTVGNLDHVLAEERWIDGVEVMHKDAAVGDTVKFQIVHPTYGVVDEFGDTWNIDASSGKQTMIVLSYPAKLAAGLTIRSAYSSVGAVNVWVGINMRLHLKT